MSLMSSVILPQAKSLILFNRAPVPHTLIVRERFSVLAARSRRGHYQQTYHRFTLLQSDYLRAHNLSLCAPNYRAPYSPRYLSFRLFCCKALAKWILPIIAHTLGMPVRSTSYIPMLNSSSTGKANGSKQRRPLHKLFFLSQDSFDIDTGIRFVQYAGLAWSVVDLVPSLFAYLNL
ncbi:Lipid phosphate phosphatase delta, partial [Cucurbita argyrosperma subsp. argyrosperma]